jgi:hypothetical protein
MGLLYLHSLDVPHGNLKGVSHVKSDRADSASCQSAPGH